MKQKGRHTITDELTLKDFSWEIRALTCYYDQGLVSIEVTFNNEKESRAFEFNTSQKALTKQDCKNYLLTLDQFKGSNDI